MPTPCDDCVAGCCREYYILPSGHDVVRIAETLALPLASFVTLRSRPQETGAFRILIHDAQGQPLYHRMELGKIAEAGEGYSARCVFLLTVAGRGRCGIYGVRPALCAAYPTSIREGALTLAGAHPYCPKGAWRLGDLDVPAHRLTHRVIDIQTIIFGAVIDAWNQHVQVQTTPTAQQASAFFAFLLRAYNLLRAQEPALFADADCPIDPGDLPHLITARLANVPA